MPAPATQFAVRPTTPSNVEPAQPSSDVAPLPEDLKCARDIARAAIRTREEIWDAPLIPIRYDPDEAERTLARCLLGVADLYPRRYRIAAVAPELSAFGPYDQDGHVVAPSAHAAAWGYARLAGQLVWYRGDGSPRFPWPIAAAELEAAIRPELRDILRRAHHAPNWPGPELAILVEVEAAKAALARRLARGTLARLAAGGRLAFDDLSQTVNLDGRQYPHVDPDAYRAFKVIAEAAPAVVTTADLGEALRLHGKRYDRILDRLPPELGAVVQSARGRGYWLTLSPGENRPKESISIR
jgi:hypothetical protein